MGEWRNFRHFCLASAIETDSGKAVAANRIAAYKRLNGVGVAVWPPLLRNRIRKSLPVTPHRRQPTLAAREISPVAVVLPASGLLLFLALALAGLRLIGP